MKQYLSIMGCIAATAITILVTATSFLATKSCIDELAWENSSQRRQMIDDRMYSCRWDPNSQEYEQLCKDHFNAFDDGYIIKIENLLRS